MPSMSITNYWLDQADRDEIKGGSAMNTRRCLVIHFTAGATGASSIESMRDSGVSAHLVIERDGKIWQCRPFNLTAGHAGESTWVDPVTGKTYEGLNSCSIGIEVANAG
jgi:N-acetyl-anhydromuramyl-L-alanine amidase AmpD